MGDRLALPSPRARGWGHARGRLGSRTASEATSGGRAGGRPGHPAAPPSLRSQKPLYPHFPRVPQHPRPFPWPGRGPGHLPRPSPPRAAHQPPALWPHRSRPACPPRPAGRRPGPWAAARLAQRCLIAVLPTARAAAQRASQADGHGLTDPLSPGDPPWRPGRRARAGPPRGRLPPLPWAPGPGIPQAQHPAGPSWPRT